jgi:hypothetical protein
MAKKDDDKVEQDIINRDRADVDKGFRSSRVFKTTMGNVPLYPDEYGKLKDTDKMAYKDAVNRLNRQYGEASEGFNADTGRQITKEEGDATRARLLKRYGITKKKGGSVKKMAKGGSVSSASKRADGCATKGKTKGRFV